MQIKFSFTSTLYKRIENVNFFYINKKLSISLYIIETIILLNEYYKLIIFFKANGLDNWFPKYSPFSIPSKE